MASITIRNLDDDAKERLRIRAAQNGRSMEEEARILLAGQDIAPRLLQCLPVQWFHWPENAFFLSSVVA
jgi:phosphopantothenoylcysteine decarboxylase/phosphopantothenate--cysteine ligase